MLLPINGSTVGRRRFSVPAASVRSPFDIAIVSSQPGLYIHEDLNGNVAHVGISKSLRARVGQYFDRRSSNVTADVAAAGLNSDRKRLAEWWLDQPTFGP